MNKSILLLPVSLIALAAVILAFTSIARSQPGQQDPHAPARAIADRVVQHISDKDISAAFDELRLHWIFPENEIQALENETVRQRASVTPRFGEPVAVEFIRKEAVGQSFVRFIYLEKFEYHGIVWIFDFYKPHDQWLFNSLIWNDQVHTFFEPAS